MVLCFVFVSFNGSLDLLDDRLEYLLERHSTCLLHHRPASIFAMGSEFSLRVGVCRPKSMANKDVCGSRSTTLLEALSEDKHH